MREVTHEATGPVRLDESDIDDQYGDIAICLCGLSDEQPFCDGSHRTTEDEALDVRYKYEGDSADGERRAVELVDAEES
jgi:CDGSH-type Zn-finger protein